jgi:glycosyltransferase involved in cell wall biosynthesis
VGAPLITIGITCYNAESTIKRAVNSARAQDWPELEIVVVDDNSGDRSVEVIEAIVDEPRLRLLRHEKNLGPGAARQTLLDHATGEYLVFFDDDDESAPERVSTQYRRIQGAGSGPVACYASGERVYDSGFRMKIDAIGSSPLEPRGEEVADYLLFNRRKSGVFYGGGTPTCALMASTKTLRAAGGFDPAFRRVEDADIAVRLALKGGLFVGCPQRLYTQYATQAPDKTALKNYEAEIQLLDKHRDYLQSKNRYRFARNWFTVRYHHFNGDRGRMVATMAKAFFQNPLLVTRQLLTTVPERSRHERRIAGGSDS